MPAIFSRKFAANFGALLAAVLATLAALYLLAGFLLVPYLVKREAPHALEATGHRVRLGTFTFNPLTLTVNAGDIAIEDAAGRPVFGAAQLEADLEWRSLFRRAAVFSVLRVVKPALNVEIDAEGRVNLAALSHDDGKKSTGLPRFHIGELSIENGTIAFADKRQQYSNRFEQLSIKLTALSTLVPAPSGYALSAQTDDGAKLDWKGDISLQPLAVSGKLAVTEINLPRLSPYLDTLLAVPFASGSAGLQLPHRFLIQDGKPQLLLEDASVTFSDVSLHGPQGSKTDEKATVPSIKLDRLAIEGIKLDLLARQVGVRLVRVEGPAVAVRRDNDGSLDITRLLQTAKPASPAAATAPSEKAEKPAPWAVSIARSELAGASISFADAATGISAALENLEGHADTLALDSKEIAFDVAGGVRGGGKLSVRGKVMPQDAGFAGHIEIINLPVAMAQPLLGKSYRLKLASGEVSLAGDMQSGGTQFNGKGARFKYSGSASVNNVAVHEAVEKGEGTRLLAWKSLATDRLNLSLGPDRLSIDELRLTAPVGRLVIAPDQSINLSRAFSPITANAAAAPPVAPPTTPAVAPAPAPAPAPAAAPASQPANAATASTKDARDVKDTKDAKDDKSASGGFDIGIRRVRISDGMLDFSDESIAQGFNIAIQELAGVFNGLSSDRSTRSDFSMVGKVGEFGYAKLSGGLNPFAWRDRTALRVEFRNVDLAKVSPYSIKFAGYRIASGRLSLDLRYRINNSVIEGDNQAAFDQLTLGEKVDSPTAMDLPIQLAISLLKDDQGRIDIALPISGSLDDPQFDYGGLIRKAIGNLITRIVTAPFRALASLFGGGNQDEVGSITFEPGQSRLLPPEREKVQRIAQGLAKRPEIRVTIPGRTDSVLDGNRLKREALSKEVSRRAGFDVGEDESAGGISIEDRRTRNAIRDLYAERFSKEELDKQRTQAEAAAREANADKPAVLDRLRNLTSGEPQVTNLRPFYASLMRRLRETQAVAPNAMEQLAEARAQSIARGLRDAGFAENRISTSVAAPTATAQARDIKVELALDKK